MKTRTQGQYSESVLDKMAATLQALAKNADFDAVEACGRRRLLKRLTLKRRPRCPRSHVMGGRRKPSGGGLRWLSAGWSTTSRSSCLSRRDPAVYDALFRRPPHAPAAMSGTLTPYEFAFRGLLTEEALDRAGRQAKVIPGLFDAAIADTLSVDVIDEQFVIVPGEKQMAAVYVAIAAFENSARELVTRVLLEAAGETRRDDCVSSPVRTHCKKRQEEEEKNRYHKQRGDAPITYTELKHLVNIMRANWEHFGGLSFPHQNGRGVFSTPSSARANVIMHSGTLDRVDIERVGINIRDWVKQVGS